MEFTAREDIESPIEYVFDQVTDFPTFPGACRQTARCHTATGRRKVSEGKVFMGVLQGRICIFAFCIFGGSKNMKRQDEIG